MAITIPGIGYLRGYEGKADMVNKFGEGFDLARNLRDEAEAPDLIAELMRLSATPQAQGAKARLAAGPQAIAAQPAAAPGGGAGSVLDVLEQVAKPTGPRDPWFSPTRLFASDRRRPAQTVPGNYPEAAGDRADELRTYLASARQAESGGNDQAQNPNSTARGRYQVLEGTWNDYAQRYPELGLTPDGRDDGDQQERFIRQFTADNAKALQGAGVPVTPGSLYATHFLGAGAAPRVLSANPQTPMTALVDPAVVEANPHLSDMTQAEFVDWANRQGTNGKNGGYSGPTAGPGGAFPTPMRAVPKPPPEMMARLFSNRATRPLAQALLAQQTAQVDQYQTFVGEDGVTYQTNLLNGETSVLRDPVKAAGSSANKAPEVVTRYNEETGRDEKVTWDETAQEWKPFGGQKATTASTRPMSPTTQKELFEADEGIMAAEGVITALDKAMTLNETAWDGPLADIGTQAGALAGDENSVDTQELKNLVTAQALEQLKAVFGAMPTEGERKILLEIQGAITQSRAVRKRIFERAKAAVERRLEFNRKKAEGLRSGSYFEEGFGGDEEAPVDDVELILREVGVM